MATTNWGKTIGTVKTGAKTELKVSVDAELDGKKFVVLSKWVNNPGSYVGPAHGGATLIPAELGFVEIGSCSGVGEQP
jgi:hypothetical protein